VNVCGVPIGKIGLILNVAGTLLIALAIGKNKEVAYQTTEKGRRQYLAAVLHPVWFKIGLVLIAAGFLLQLLD
jgi:hypothetical protein